MIEQAEKIAASEANKIPRICFCGRPNVGKSSLFNRLLGRKKALVLDEPGVTRDVYRTQVEWDGKKVELADLAGLELWETRNTANHNKKEQEAAALRKLATQAAIDYLKTADLVLFVVDGRQQLTPSDEELARLIRSTAKSQILLVLSKIEGNAGEQAQIEASKLGWGEAIPTSAEHKLGIEDLREKIMFALFGEPEILESDEHELDIESEAQEKTETQEPAKERGYTIDRPIRLGVYGRPNVGKSTLVNELLGENRMITSPIAGTTVDTVDTDFIHEGKYFRILDTAGIRRKSKTERGVEVLSVVQALKSIQDVDVALFLIDGYEGVTDQDEKVAGELVKAGKPVIIVVNKWDVCKTDREEYAERIRETLGFLDFAPILFISAKKGEGLEVLWELTEDILKSRFIVVSTGELNRFLEIVEGANNPTGVKLYYATQTSKNPPTITILVSDPKKVHFAYERYLRNELRNRYGWMGSPVRLVFKARKRSPSKKARDNY